VDEDVRGATRVRALQVEICLGAGRCGVDGRPERRTAVGGGGDEHVVGQRARRQAVEEKVDAPTRAWREPLTVLVAELAATGNEKILAEGRYVRGGTVDAAVVGEGGTVIVPRTVVLRCHDAHRMQSSAGIWTVYELAY